MSHSACKPLSASVLGQSLDDPRDIARINALVRSNSFDLLQTDHTLSGIDIALWDLLGKKFDRPVFKLLGFEKAYPKMGYASQLFGADPQETFRKGKEIGQTSFRAAKFGWGPYGRGSVEEDAEHVHAAREGLGNDRILLIDAGTVWGDDVQAAEKRLPALEQCKVRWLEEPFVNGALDAYRILAGRSSRVKLAGGEGCHDFYQAKNLVDYGSVGYIQIDAGRIGGITTAKRVAEYAIGKSVQFVNHTFTTPLALSASLQAYAGSESDNLCECPSEPSLLARQFSKTLLQPDEQGLIHLPPGTGLGIEPNPAELGKYGVPVEITVDDRIIFKSGRLSGGAR